MLGDSMTAMGGSSSKPLSDDSQDYSRRLQAEVEAEARRIRREQPEVERLESEMERALGGVVAGSGLVLRTATSCW